MGQIELGQDCNFINIVKKNQKKIEKSLRDLNMTQLNPVKHFSRN